MHTSALVLVRMPVDLTSLLLTSVPNQWCPCCAVSFDALGKTTGNAVPLPRRMADNCL